MTPEHNDSLDPVPSLGQVEQMASVNDRRVTRKKEGGNQPKQKRKHRTSVEEQLEEEQQHLLEHPDENEGHVDFHA